MKKLTPKQNQLVANIIMGIGAAFAAVDILFFDLLAGENNNQPVLIILAFVFFVLGFAYRLKFVKCPHCGDGLTGQKKVPDVCPACGKSLDYTKEEADSEKADS